MALGSYYRVHCHARQQNIVSSVSSELRARTSRGGDYCLLEALSPYTGQEAVRGLLLFFLSISFLRQALVACPSLSLPDLV